MYSINCNVYLHFFANKLKQMYFGNVYILLRNAGGASGEFL